MGFMSCMMDINDYVFSRRCFMTGEYCSKQLNVQRERERLHNKGEINAFVIMSFSDMSDVVYKWRIQSFVESLARNLYFKSETAISKTDFCSFFPDVVNALSSAEEDTNAGEKAFKEYISTLDEYEKEASPIDSKGTQSSRFRYQDMSNLCCYASEEAHKDFIFNSLGIGVCNSGHDNHVLQGRGAYYPELKVRKINVIRADSNPSSNFVICNRVCQQMQIADLVVVDVSDENTNVFYELGMAIALGKMILPICYSESYYNMKLPPELKNEQREYRNRLRNAKVQSVDNSGVAGSEEREINTPYNMLVRKLEHHIDCFPWQRQLFEYFGIRYRNVNTKDENSKEEQDELRETISYFSFDNAVNDQFGFSDRKYSRFPYFATDEPFSPEITPGKKLYERLQEAFNYSGRTENTLVVYTMDGFLNPTEGGQCIVNYYRAIVTRMDSEACFCGDRVGILVQSSAIAEEVKDAEEKRHLLYSVGEIIQIGMNQATYDAHREMIKPVDYLASFESDNDEGDDTDKEQQTWMKEIVRFTKAYIRNRSLPIYPRDPVYVKRVVTRAQTDLFDGSLQVEERDAKKDHFFCLYHVMLRNLKYVDEVAVDVTQNSVQSLFWLGAAHASGVYAISIRQERSEGERQLLLEAANEKGVNYSVKKTRSIFDISGLWTAVLHSFDTERFYSQLAQVQLGIEQSRKLMLQNVEYYENQIGYAFWEPGSTKHEWDRQDFPELFDRKEKDEAELLESYYRDRFWRPMIRRNRLQIYSTPKDNRLRDGEPRSAVDIWDMDAISSLSLYLSKRKLIGEYQFKTLKSGQRSITTPAQQEAQDRDLHKKSYICVGQKAGPFSDSDSLSEYLSKTLDTDQRIFDRFVEPSDWDTRQQWEKCEGKKYCYRLYKGFKLGKSFLFRQNALNECISCQALNDETKSQIRENLKSYRPEALITLPCALSSSRTHTQFAQLLLWSENTQDGELVFRASMCGVSGPATYALSTLFVDEPQKIEMFGERFYSSASQINNFEDAQEDKTKRYPLSELQRRVRKIILAEYQKLLENRLNRILNDKLGLAGEDSAEEHLRRDEYIARVVNAAKAYLSTVLYQYFFPILSWEDKAHICNGIRFFAHSVMAANLSPFALNYPAKRSVCYLAVMDNDVVISAADAVVETLESLLDRFCALEVFYEVEVTYENGIPEQEYDLRRPLSISLVDYDSLNISDLGPDSFPVRCIFKTEKG